MRRNCSTYLLCLPSSQLLNDLLRIDSELGDHAVVPASEQKRFNMGSESVWRTNRDLIVIRIRGVNGDREGSSIKEVSTRCRGNRTPCDIMMFELNSFLEIGRKTVRQT